jgi:polyisoprenoid-binding protein YceI
MRKSSRLVGMAVVSSAVLALVACKNPAKDKPEAKVTAPAPEAAVAPSPAGGPPVEQLALNSENTKVTFVGAKVTGRHDGGFRNVRGIIELSPTQPTATRLDVEIDATSIWTDTDKLTAHLKSPDFFDVEKFPQIKFTSTAITSTAPGQYNITGNLEFHGVKKTITFPATVAITPDQVQFKSEFSLNRKEFGLMYTGARDDLIRDDVLIRLEGKVPRAK